MSRPRTVQELVHWLELGSGAAWVRRAAVVLGVVALSLLMAWKQFRGPVSEDAFLHAGTAWQLSQGGGFTTLVNYPQTEALLAARGERFDPAQAFPELHHAPLYPLLGAAAIRLLPSGLRASLFSELPAPPNGYGGDYVLLGLNLALFWLAAWLTYLLASRLFSPRAGWLASLALLASIAAWRQVVALDGVALLMVLGLVTFLVWTAVDARAEAEDRLPLGWLAALGAACGLLWLTEYAAGSLVVVALGYAGWRFRSRGAVPAGAAVLVAFLLVCAPWAVRNIRLTGHPTGLARHNVALKAGDPTAEPEALRLEFSTEAPAIELRKLANKALTSLQASVRERLWASGGLFLAAFFVAGWLYAFRDPTANCLRWVFTVSLLTAVAVQSVFGSGDNERLAIQWLAPPMMVLGAGFFFVLLDANSALAGWPRAAAAVLLAAQVSPLARDALEPRRLHFSYPPYSPGVFIGMRLELERRGAAGGGWGLMSDVPAGAAWYARQRVWAQPARLRDFYRIHNEQPIGELLLSPRTLDRPFFSELAAGGAESGSLTAATRRFGEWGEVYAGFLTGRVPAGFPLTTPMKLADNLYLLLNPGLPPPPGN